MCGFVTIRRQYQGAEKGALSQHGGRYPFHPTPPNFLIVWSCFPTKTQQLQNCIATTAKLHCNNCRATVALQQLCDCNCIAQCSRLCTRNMMHQHINTFTPRKQTYAITQVRAHPRPLDVLIPLFSLFLPDQKKSSFVLYVCSQFELR